MFKCQSDQFKHDPQAKESQPYPYRGGQHQEQETYGNERAYKTAPDTTVTDHDIRASNIKPSTAINCGLRLQQTPDLRIAQAQSPSPRWAGHCTKGDVRAHR
jgi:hypothetical protein